MFLLHCVFVCLVSECFFPILCPNSMLTLFVRKLETTLFLDGARLFTHIGLIKTLTHRLYYNNIEPIFSLTCLLLYTNFFIIDFLNFSFSICLLDASKNGNAVELFNSQLKRKVNCWKFESFKWISIIGEMSTHVYKPNIEISLVFYSRIREDASNLK